MFDLIRPHVYLLRKWEVVVDLTSLEGTQVKIESLQMENQVIRDVLKTCSRKWLIRVIAWHVICIPFDRIHMTITCWALVFIVWKVSVGFRRTQRLLTSFHDLAVYISLKAFLQAALAFDVALNSGKWFQTFRNVRTFLGFHLLYELATIERSKLSFGVGC